MAEGLTGRGGAREGAGRPPAGYVPPPGRDDYELERARHEKIKADQRAFKLAVEQGDYLPRDEVKQASAIALAILTSSIRQIPDACERAHALPPQVTEAIAVACDAALAELAKAFEAMHRGS